ncbi:MAG TPA: nucleotidyltransferase family protein [Pirellulales bacterium]|nr:nucleotidyltransferase family protein [Pirellulales bacterium]
MATYGEVSWERMIRAVEKVRERLLRATAALEKAGIPYAVAGGNAVAAWVSRVDEAAVRNTQDVDILVRRADFPAVTTALEAAGFYHAHVLDVESFLDSPTAKVRDAVHILFAGEKVKPGYETPAAEMTESERGKDFQMLQLEALVRMKLTSFRDKDRTHLRDMIDVGLIDQSWPTRFPNTLAVRLQQLLDTPGG